MFFTSYKPSFVASIPKGNREAELADNVAGISYSDRTTPWGGGMVRSDETLKNGRSAEADVKRGFIPTYHLQNPALGLRVYGPNGSKSDVSFGFWGVLSGSKQHDKTTGFFRAAASTPAVSSAGVEGQRWGTTEVVVNDGSADVDFRVEGDVVPSLIHTDAAESNIAICASALPAWQALRGGVFLENAIRVPTGDPTAGGYLYAEAGALKWRGSGGTVTTIAPA